MNLKIVSKSTSKTKIQFYFTEGKKITPAFQTTNKNKIPDFNAKKNETAVYHEKNIRYIAVGLGAKKEISPESIRCAASTALKALKAKEATDASLYMPEKTELTPNQIAKHITEGLVLTDYNFNKYKSDKKNKKIIKIDIISKNKIQKTIKETKTICDCVKYSRDLVNDNASEIIPSKLASEARKIAQKNKLKIKILTEKEIKKEKLGLLQAVGQGSPFPPRLIIIEYKGNKKSKTTTAIVGKGITFDSGGLNLKPGRSIIDMRSDMAGAAAVLGVIKAASELKLKTNIIAVVSAAYNAIGSNAYIPGDIYKSYNGKTVEIKNTDAEGRLVLADAISYTIKKHKPSQIIDLATLTGAICVTFSDICAGLVSNNDKLSDNLLASAKNTHERLWRLPLYDEFKDALKGDLADLRNISNIDGGGSITAGAFLEAFTENTPWAHLDIAGTAFSSKPNAYNPKNATGYGVRLLIDYFENQK